ncbi:hypothetical protein [Scytonema sp. UIC 10036]|nr:hypothetical protein [Scytonema sp. UIC 10036]
MKDLRLIWKKHARDVRNLSYTNQVRLHGLITAREVLVRSQQLQSRQSVV